MSHAIVDLDLAFIDVSANDIVNVIIEIIRKQMGIVLANMPDKRELKFEVVTKFDAAHDYRSDYIKAMVVEDLPPLLEILDRSNFPEHDEIRFKLLKFMVGIIRLRKFDFRTFPLNYLQDILTVTFLRHHDFIDPFEADLVLLTIKHVEDKTVPENLTVPQKLNEKAFRIPFLFAKFHKFIDECFQIAGLNDFTVNFKNFFVTKVFNILNLQKLINFDGVLFHNLYLEHIDRPHVVMKQLDDILPYRIYKGTL